MKLPIILAILFTAMPLKAEVSFDRDVMSVLSKAGCNQGTCHGNQNGKGGFKLSLRGQDPAFDFESLTRGSSSRRVNLSEPSRSLILLKSTMEIPHQGGKRFDSDFPEFQILQQWIMAGTPRQSKLPRVKELIVEPTDVVAISPLDQVTLKVTAVFDDAQNSRRDVTRLTVFETSEPIVDVSAAGQIQRRDYGQTVVIARYLDQQVPVRVAFIPPRDGFERQAPPAANAIDTVVFKRLEQLRMNPSPVCDDVTFLRRTFLDLTGRLPSPQAAREFLSDDLPSDSAAKRTKLVQQLLDSQEHADFWSQKWCDLLRNEETTLDRKGVQNLHAWIRREIQDDMPFDQFARELVAGRGSTYTNPPANYYRALRTADMRSESTAQLFLGIRVQCAKCHNHPFAEWTQDDYYGWTNLFARVDYMILENDRKDQNDKHEFDGEQIVITKSDGEVKHPSGRVIKPRFLDAKRSEAHSNRDRLVSLGAWLTSPENERFAQNQVNRVWHQLLGRGIVDPIDDFRATNPPSHPELLDFLTREFVEHNFSTKYLIRLIMASATYQLSAEPNSTNGDDELNFSHARIKRLSAEQLTDAISDVTGVPVVFNGYPLGLKATQIPGVRAIRRSTPSSGDQFLSVFGKPPRLTTCECERGGETTLSQAFQLISGPLMNELLAEPQNDLQRLLSQPNDTQAAIVELYFKTLSRSPSPSELDHAIRLLSQSKDQRRTLEDVAWALMNSNEFLFRQ